MATTNRLAIGRTRTKLARLLNEALAETLAIHQQEFRPGDLHSQIPVYATPQWDCCSWYGDSDGQGPIRIHVSCWATMGECVKCGIDASADDSFSFEISPRG
jgi:hypothetical protein